MSEQGLTDGAPHRLGEFPPDGSSAVRHRRRRRLRARPSASARLAALRALLEDRGVEVTGGLLAASVFGSVLAIGTAHVGTLLVIAPLVLAAGSIALWLQPASWRELPRPAFVALALAAYCILQAVPLPIAAVEWIGPRNAEIWRSSLGMLGESSPSWISVSLDPGATLVESLKWICYAAAFIAAALVGRSKGSVWALQLVFSSALLVALVTLLHKVVGAETVYGVYKPEFAHPNFALSPLLNSNNLAGYLNLGAFSGAALVVSRRRTGPRWLIAIAVSVTIAVGALTASRGGWMALVAGVPLLGVALLVTRNSAGAPRRLAVLLPIGALGGGLALFLLGASDAVWRALRDEGHKKLDLIAWSGPMISEHRWVGVGRGAFETVFPAYRGDAGHHLYAHAENFIAQWCAEWGVPVGAAALLGFAWLLRPRILGAQRSAAVATAYVGVAVLLLHNLVDLALELPSVSLALFALLGGLWGAASKTRATANRSRPAVTAPPAGFAAAGVSALLLVALLGATPAGPERRELGQRVEAARTTSAPEQGALLRDIGSAVRRHPADPFLPLLGAVTLQRSGQNALPWIARAIERDPMSGRPHILLAHVLAARGARTQALLAVKMAVERDSALSSPGATLAIAIGRNAEDLLRAAPEGPRGVAFLVQLARLSNAPSRALHRELLLDEAIRRNPTNRSALVMRAADLLADLDDQSTNCASGPGRNQCKARVRELASLIERNDRDSDRPTVYRARLLLLDNRGREAEELLAKNCRLVSAHLDCLRLRVQVADELTDGSALQTASSAYVDAACAVAEGCASATAWVGDRLSARGDWVGAVKMYERAARESGDRRAWERLAKAAMRAGDSALAMRAWQKAGSRRKAP